MRILTALLLTSCSVAAIAQPGTLDPTFGTNGRALAVVTGNYSSGECIAEQTDGKIIVGGATPGYALLARFNTDGSLDTGFGTNGLVLTDVDASNDFIATVSVQPDGKIVAGGVRFNAAADGQAIVIRYTPSGTLDAGFGTNGIRTISFSGTTDSYIKALRRQTDGRIVACGERYTGSEWESFVLRLNSDGTTDNGFGTVQLDISTNGDDNVTDLVLQNNGRIVVCGTVQSATGGGIFVARLNANGSFDNTFGSGGKQVLDIGGGGSDAGYSVRVQDDGRILVSGVIDTENGYRVGVARMLANGTLDGSFGTNGSVLINLGIDDWALPTLAMQPDGKILVGADNNVGDPARVKVIRLLTDGTFDATFGTNGIGTSNATIGDDYEYAVRTLFLSDGGIAVAGFVDTPNNTQVAVWKFRSGVNVGMDEAREEDGLQVVPNPVDASFDLIVPGRIDPDASFTVLDMKGRVVPAEMVRHDGRTAVDVSHLPSGTYQLTLVDKGGRRSVRFIKR